MKYTNYYALKGLEVLRDKNLRQAKDIQEAVAELIGEDKTKWGYEQTEDWFYMSDRTIEELIEMFND